MSATDSAGVVPKAKIPAAEAPKPEGLMALAVGVVVVVALYLGRDMLIPITLAILLSFVLAPLVGLLRRLRLPKVMAVLLAVLLALGVILLIGGLIGSQIASLAGDLPRYQATVLHKFESIRSFAVERLQAVTSHLVPHGAGPHSMGPEPTAMAATSSAAVGPQPVPVAVQEPSPSPLALAQRFLEPILSPIETVGIVLVVAIFILMQQEDLRDRLIRLFGSSDLHRTTLAIDDAAQRLSRYFLTQVCINAGFGVVIGIGLTIIGVPSPILWGVLGMLLRFVPYIGSLIAALLPVCLAAAVDPQWGMAIWTLALFLITEAIIGQAVEPLLYGHSTGLSPVAVIVVAIFWSWLWGPIGLILSTPLTLCLVVVGRHVKRLEFFDVLLGDRPALTPVETFYQRLLAHDPDEMLEQAEELLETRSLSSYYDEVALKSLQLAAGDVTRGVVTEAQILRLRGDLQSLIDELDEHEDTDPPQRLGREAPSVAGVARPDRGVPDALPAPEASAEEVAGSEAGDPAQPPLVLCVAGRGVLDDAASGMLAQLLRKHGCATRLVSHEETSRAGIANLDLTGVTMICVSFLEMAGHPTHLRYLLRRLRLRDAEMPILVGLWPQDDPFLANEEMRLMMGASAYVTSLRDAVIQCIALCRPTSAVPETASIAA
jgi:predicted PurR-regulated permease PerM